MKKIFVLLSIIGLSFLATQQTFAQTDQSFAAVNVDSVIVNMAEYKTQSKQLEIYGQQLQTQIQNMQQQLQQDVAQFQQDAQLPDAVPAQLQERYVKLQEQEQDLLKKQQEAQVQFQKKEQELLKPLSEKMLDMINEVAKELGYTYVLNSNTYLYFDNAHDITDKVIERLK